MKVDKYNKLIERLNIILDADGVNPSVSPASNSSCENSFSQGVYITSQIDVDALTNKELTLVHTLLHKFYATGNKLLNKEQIREVHKRVKDKINHFDFDSLDY